MEAIEKLKNIGAREISKHTHMALNKVQCILDFNFAELKDHTTTIGLIKILEREYNVDLQKWQEEYNEFCNSHQELDTENLETTINFKITHEMIKQDKSKQYIFVSAIIIIFLGIGFYAYTNFLDYFAKTEETTTSQESTQTESITTPPIVENNSTANTTNANTLANTEALPTNNSLDASASAPINSQTKNEEQSSTQTAQTEQLENTTSTTTKQKLEIIPHSNVWIGIVYLDTRKKTSLLTNTPLEIDLTRPQTIITGHGMLDLNSDGKLTNYNQAEKMLFMVDEAGNFSEITLAQYNQYTKGLGW